MKALIRFLCILLLPLVVFGQTTNGTPTANVSWTAPSAYTDGTPMPSTDIAFYTVLYGSKSVQVKPPALTAVVNALCGSVNFTVTVTTTATAVVPNATSTPAGPVPFVSPVLCGPNAPGNLKVS